MLQLNAQYAVLDIDGTPSVAVMNHRLVSGTQDCCHAIHGRTIASVISAGSVVWTPGADLKVRCEGQGAFYQTAPKCSIQTRESEAWVEVKGRESHLNEALPAAGCIA